MAITVGPLRSNNMNASLMATGVPVYANEGDNAASLVMWFFDSRSFVSGTGDGPGESIVHDELPLILR